MPGIFETQEICLDCPAPIGRLKCGQEIVWAHLVTGRPSADKPAQLIAADRKPYAPPTLRDFGPVAALTQSGTGMNPENMMFGGPDRRL